MLTEWWTSIGAGIGVGVLYLTALLVTTLRAVRHRNSRRFMTLFAGGMVVRIALAMATIVLVITLAAVSVPVFIGAFLVVFVGGLAVEIVLIHRGGWINRQKG